LVEKVLDAATEMRGCFMWASLEIVLTAAAARRRGVSSTATRVPAFSARGGLDLLPCAGTGCTWEGSVLEALACAAPWTKKARLAHAVSCPLACAFQSCS
jgi:hypothetical protein